MNFVGLGPGFQAQAFYDPSIDTANLIGNFDPTTGINTNYWDNQVGGGKNLRRFNGVSHNNSTPHNFAFDGTNDYFGEAESGYGGDALYIDNGGDFSIGQWFKHANNKKHIILTLNYSDSDVFLIEIGRANNNRIRVVADSNTDMNYVFQGGTWYYVGISYNQSSGVTKLYINGAYEEQVTNTMSNVGDCVAMIGKEAANNVYSGSGIKLAHTHIYEREVSGTTFRGNYLATHKPKSDLIYGTDFTR